MKYLLALAKEPAITIIIIITMINGYVFGALLAVTESKRRRKKKAVKKYR